MFDVAKDKQKPFIIRSGDIRVRVTGTVFNFKSYPEERFAKVSFGTRQSGCVECDGTCAPYRDVEAVRTGRVGPQ